MKRLYRCAVIGAGTDDNEFRPKVADYEGASWAVCEDFAPGADFVSVEVVADPATHDAIALDPGVEVLP